MTAKQFKTRESALNVAFSYFNEISNLKLKNIDLQLIDTHAWYEIKIQLKPDGIIWYNDCLLKYLNSEYFNNFRNNTITLIFDIENDKR